MLLVVQFAPSSSPGCNGNLTFSDVRSDCTGSMGTGWVRPHLSCRVGHSPCTDNAQSLLHGCHREAPVLVSIGLAS